MTRSSLALAVAASLLMPSCGDADKSTAAEATRIRTIEREHLPDTRLAGDIQSDATASDTSDQLDLPFEPPISMDPVDGSKVSIRRTTPTAEHGGRIYHFSSEENRALFLADPKKYLTGTLATY